MAKSGVGHILRAADYQVMPWKNGLGSTTEIARSSNSDNLNDFDWRVSMAQVTRDGPFSSFPGIDRTLLVLSGAGIFLTVADRAPVRLDRNSMHSFPGDQPTSAALIDGAIVDLNIMTRRGVVRHTVQRIKVMSQLAFQASAVTLLFIEHGELKIQNDNVELGAIRSHDAILIDDEISRREIELIGDASVAVMEFRR